MSVKDVLELVQKLNEQSQQTIVAAIREARKPSDYEQIKIDKEQESFRKRMEARISAAKSEEEMKRLRMLSCPHKATHPLGFSRHTFGAQVHKPPGQKPYFVPTCQRCLTQLPKVYCSQDQLTEGVSLEEYKSIGADDLLKWAELSGNTDAVAEFRTRYMRIKQSAPELTQGATA